MGDEKENDFWKSSSDDDFWNTGSSSDDEFWNTDSSADYSGLSKDFFEDEKPREDPYYEKEIKRQENRPLAENGVRENKKKRIPVRTVICLTAVLLAVFSIATAAVLTKTAKERALDAARNLDYRQEEVSDSFLMYENNKVTLENQAYTIVTKESFRGFPEGLKLIAVYAEVESGQYSRDSYAMRDIYIGFEENGANSYKKPAGKELITPYVYGYGFQEEQILSVYGIGNGSDDSGFYFFFVPEDIDKITLYAEQKKTVEKIQVMDTLYRKEMKVLPEDEKLTGELVEREGR